MNTNISAIIGAAKVEAIQLLRSPLLVVLTGIQAITFLILVSLFGLTGSMAPTALVNYDQGSYSKSLIQNLQSAHHSFRLEPMSSDEATKELAQGKLVAEIIIPSGFSQTIINGGTASLTVNVDNIDTDMTHDIQRALPSAISHFANQQEFPNIHVTVSEHDLINHDTSYISYLIVSALALDAFVVAGILSAVSAAREFELGTVKLLWLAPVHPIFPFIGRMITTDIFAMASMIGSGLIVVAGYNVHLLHPFEMCAALSVCVFICGCAGTMLGTALKRVLPVSSLIFGLAIPFYVSSGALEPERFDGNFMWYAGHISPLYYAVGFLEHAAYGFQVTPEPIFLDVIMLFVWAIAMMLLTGYILQRKLVI